MKSLNEHKGHLNEGREISPEMLTAVQNALPELSKLIQKELGFSPKLVAVKEDSRNGEYIRIKGSDNLVKELGNTLVKTFFKEITVYFWGGTKLYDENKIWFNPKLSYEHPGGGSNGTDFIWDSIWFDLDTNKWITGRKIF